jgi:hypothetical protein
MSANLASAALPQPNTLTDDAGGAKAIEVATMLGDSVVDVKHCIDPKSGKVSPKTWGLAAAGLSCVLLSAVAFGVSVQTAARNKQRLEYWTHVQKKPAGAFRAEQLGFSYDWLAFGGFALGLGALAGSLSRMRKERRSPYYRIGTSPDVEQPVTGAPAGGSASGSSFPLVAPSATGDDFVMNFGAGVSGETMIDGKLVTLAELAQSGRARASATVPGAFEMPIPMGSRIRAQVGQTSFVVSGVGKPREHAAPFLAGLESRTMTYFAGSLAAHLGVVLLLSQVPVEDSNVAIDLATAEDTLIKAKGTETETPPPEQEHSEDAGSTESEAQMASSMRLDPGEAGDKKSASNDGHIRIAQRQETPVLSRAQAIEEARNAGFLGSLRSPDGAKFADIMSDSDFASGFDNVDVLGHIYGADGEAHGSFGFGRTGFGGGCDVNCNGMGIIGTTGYGKIGLGKFGKQGYDGPGGFGPGTRRHQATPPTVTISDAKSVGDLDPAIIRRYIKRNLEKISYCYERHLMTHPGAEGSVKVQFLIAPNGTVQTSTGAGFNAEVANCVADVVSHIEFPKPNGGGAVQVNYPFTFHAAKGQ